MTKAQLIAELERLKPTPQTCAVIEYRTTKPKPRAIVAGMDLLKDDLLVVDEASRIAYVYPEVKTVPHKVRIHGYAARAFKKGQIVRIKHWLTYDPARGSMYHGLNE